MKHFRFFSLFLVFVFLVSCNFMPSTLVPRLGNHQNLSGGAQVQTISQANTSAPGESAIITVHQESRATRSPLVQPSPELAALLSNTREGIDISRTGSTNGIKMPTTGPFKVTFTSGSHFRIIDGDATDGMAIVELPKGNYLFGLQATDRWSSKSSLTFEDDLYYLRDELKESSHGWLFQPQGVAASLGTKPLPVPEAWHGPAQQNLVFTFEAKDLDRFRLLWQAQATEAPYPPGVGKIGVAGGSLSLPGVGEIQIPEGALIQYETISIREIPEHELFPGVLQLSSTISIKPKNINLKKPILVKLNFDTEVVGENDPGVINYTFLKKNCDPESGSCIASLISNVHVEEMSLDSWHILSEIPEELYVTMMDIFVGKNTKVYSSLDSRFQIQQTEVSSANFIVRNTLPNRYSEQDVRMLLASLERGWRIYAASFGEPVPNLHDRGKIPVLLADKARYAVIHALPAEIDNPTVTNFYTGGNNNWSIIMPRNVGGTTSGKNSQRVSRTQAAYHELFHVFQNTNLPSDQRARNANPVYGSPDSGWLLESTARFVGYKMFHDNFANYQQTMDLSPRDMDYIYRGSSYFLNLFEGLQSNIREEVSIYQQPYVENGTDPIYAGTHIVGPLQHRIGFNNLVNLNKNYSRGGKKGTKAVFDSLNKILPLDDKFVEWAENFAFMNYGIGTSSFANVKYLSQRGRLPDGSLGSGINLSLSPFKGSKNKAEYNNSNTQQGQISFDNTPLKPGAIKFLQITPEKTFVDTDNLAPVDKKLFIYIDLDVNKVSDKDISNTRIYFHKKNTVDKEVKPVIETQNGNIVHHTMNKKSLIPACGEEEAKTRYFFQADNFVDNYDRATIIVANGNYSSPKNLIFPVKAFVPRPTLCDLTSSNRDFEIKGRFLNEVKSIVLTTEKGQKVAKPETITEDGSALTAKMPEGTNQIINVLGVTCDGESFLAYAEDNFAIASVASGPTCGCGGDCVQTNTLSILPELLSLYADPESGQKLRGTAKFCAEESCEMIFKARSRALLKEKVKVLSTSPEGIQQIEVIPPNEAIPGTEVLLNARGYTSNAMYMPALCHLLSSDYRLNALSPCSLTNESL
jgi:hypothetical protein